MSSTSTKPASGFRDFLPDEARRRQRVFEVVREVYEAHGFEPLETPCMERLDALLGKYGEEGDQLLFKILQRGEKLERALQGEALGELDLADLGMRYDLTVPLARVYAEHANDLPRYFKRYQIAPVWRADRPQRGRFREFYQCDVDVIGSDSMAVEAEVTSALATVLERLGFQGARVHINHRQMLRAVIEAAGIDLALEGEALTAIDKLDKIGLERVTLELEERGIAPQAIDRLLPVLALKTRALKTGGYDNLAALQAIAEVVGELDSGKRALKDLHELFALSQHGSARDLLVFDPYLARGLSYYTGSIFEIRSDAFAGSLGGGGRYDGLIGMFSKQSVPACGFSLGVERLLVLMQERDGEAAEALPGAEVLVTQWDEASRVESFRLAADLRAQGFKVDLYPDVDKYKKQFKYASQRHIPFVALLGKDEIAAGQVSLKDMARGEQATYATRSDLYEALRRGLTHQKG